MIKCKVSIIWLFEYNDFFKYKKINILFLIFEIYVNRQYSL